MRKAGSVKAFSAFFMCPVSHTFPAYNGNEMPSWYTIIFFVYGRVVYKPRCLLLFFMWELSCQFARGRGMISPQCPGTPRVKPHKKSRLFSDRGPCLFSVRGFVRLHGCGRGLSPVVVFHPGPRRKSGFPGLCQPVAHACKPKRNPAIFRFKICGFPGVAATTRRSLSGRTCRRSEPFSL